MKKLAINGFGRIGRASIKIALESPELDVIAINDLMHIENAAYLLKFDSVYGRYNNTVEVKGDDALYL
ncbi:glyceraldehyde 3-phosphate dehydrogenase NAD-binding domain-containing protein [Mucilaginibacter lappiensis]|uniref:glyceraldehyde 3-phosphate dehydrogenase NAD-binding domain-containing protein n=1 Tax=Mucilaginibacter lappiensis TaxID=354630 RepID=UPI003D227036